MAPTPNALVTHPANALPALALASLGGWLSLPHAGPSAMMLGICGAGGLGLAAGWTRLLASLAVTSPGSLLLTGLAMLLAMVPPLMARPLTRLAASTGNGRRAPIIGVFVIAYAMIWMAAEAVLTVAMFVIALAADGLRMSPLALSLVIAVAWQATPLKQRALNLCHQLGPASPAGLRQAGSHGVEMAVGCIGACWALMLLPMMQTGDNRLGLGVVTLVLLLERRLPARSPHWGAALAPGRWGRVSQDGSPSTLGRFFSLAPDHKETGPIRKLSGYRK